MKKRKTKFYKHDILIDNFYKIGRQLTMDILELIERRTKYPLGMSTGDAWIVEATDYVVDEFAIIAPENSLNDNLYGRNGRNRIQAILVKYNLKAMFDIQNPYASTNVKFFLYVFSKEACDQIKYGIYKKQLKNKNNKSNNSGEIVIPNEYPEEYIDYLSSIEDFIDNDACPQDTDSQEFGIIDSSVRDKNVWDPNRYNKQTVEIKKALRKEETVPLSSVATIIKPRYIGKENYTKYCLAASNWNYPINYDKLKEGRETNCPLHKGDIIFISKDKMFLLYETPPYPIHTNSVMMAYIIRPTNISPEYLYLYLKSETAQVVIQSIQVGGVLPKIKLEDIKNFPVILPREDIENYKNIFYTQNFSVKNIDNYNHIMFQLAETKTDECVEGILNQELVDNFKFYKTDILEKFLEQDINELNICYNHKAYKATLILAGSILEAILIDWLSEIKGINYFDEANVYKVKKPKRDKKTKQILCDENGKTIFCEKDAVLSDYIDEIKILEKPPWCEADKAHTIRKKRNLVHAKLCLKEETKIDEALCNQVKQYLIDVLQSRSGRKVKLHEDKSQSMV